MNVPCILEKLVQDYSQVIEEAGSKDVLKTAFQIVSRGLLPEEDCGDFEVLLARQVKKLLEEEKAFPFEYPSAFPKNNEELYSKYKSLVLSSLRRVIRWGLDVQDSEQEVWAKLFASDVLGKYLSYGILQRLPTTLTGGEACDYLGLEWEDWLTAIELTGLKPISGDPSEEGAAFELSAVKALEASGTLGSFPRQLPASTVCIRKFEVYLRTAAQNHSRNILRTHERRSIKDGPMRNPHVALAQGDTGTYRVTHCDAEGRESWESNLSESAPSIEDLCDAHALAENMGAQDSVAYSDVLNYLAKIARRSGVELSSEEGAAFARMVSESWGEAEAETFMRKIQAKASSVAAVQVS